MAKCREISPGRKFRFKNKLLTLDSMTVALCASIFDWARWRQTKGAVKLHLLLDYDGYLPVFEIVTAGKAADVTVAQNMDFSQGKHRGNGRGYLDYKLFTRWTRQGVFFVSRLKAKADAAVFKSRPVAKGERSSRTKSSVSNPLRRAAGFGGPAPGGRLAGGQAGGTDSGDQPLHAGRFDRRRHLQRGWYIDLFFKLLKQHLKIKTFVATSANAVRIQIWTALIAVLVVRYLQFRSKFRWAVSHLVALLRWNLFTYRDLWVWIDRPFETPPAGAEQLSFHLDSTGAAA